MSKQLWNRVAEELDRHDYMTGVDRTVERVQATAEVFTPTPLVLEMLQYMDLELFAPGKTVLDPACGDGQFLVAAKALKMYHHGMSSEDALEDLFGVDLMRDNVDLCLRRLGGGTILMGDALAPERQLAGQTIEEHEAMIALFGGADPHPKGRGRGAAQAYANKRVRKPVKRRLQAPSETDATLF